MGVVMLQGTGSDVGKSVLGRIGVTASGRDYHADVDARHGDVGGLLAPAGRGKGSA